VIIFLFFGYQKWWNYEAQVLIPYISNGPLISWMYPVFGIRGTCYFLGVSEWSLGPLSVLWILEQRNSASLAPWRIASFVLTVTIIPFHAGCLAPSAGGFSAMDRYGRFLMKDVVLLAASFYLLSRTCKESRFLRSKTSPAQHRTSPGVESHKTVRQTA